METERRAPGALELVLELARAERSGEAFAVRRGVQSYLVRWEGGVYAGAELAWNEALRAGLDGVRQTPPDRGARQQVGERLRAFLGAADWSAREQEIVAAVGAGRPVTLTIRSAAAELYTLPWEVVTLRTGQGGHLGALRGCLLRYEWPGHATAPPAREPPPEGGRILFAWSGAGGHVPFAAHRGALERAARAGHHAFDAERDVVASASTKSLREALAARPPAVLHVLCHGGRVASDVEAWGLVWDASWPGGPPETVDPSTLGALLAPYAGTLRLVVLAACDGSDAGEPGNPLGSAAQELHKVGIPAVVASRQPLTKAGSITLTEAFYDALLVGLTSVEEAFLAAREALRADTESDDWAGLQLHARAADGRDHRPIVVRPYRGLRPFTPEDRRFYFGREADVDRLLEALKAGQRLLTVVGASGSGKSSVVMAGLVPAIAAGALGGTPVRARILRPGASPCRALSAALAPLAGGPGAAWQQATLSDASVDLRDALLARPDALARAVAERLGSGPSAPRLLLVVDQLEELANLGADRADRDAFVANLLDAAARPEAQVLIVLTLRADFLGKTLELSRPLAERLEASLRIMMPMSEAQLDDVIRRPAARVGLRFDDGVVEALLDALRAGSAAENLPLLEFALERLWERRRGDRIPWSAWEALDGLVGALTQRADAVLAQAPGEAARALARDIFGRLVQIGEGAADTRRYATRAELEALAPGEAGRELDRWIDARLLTADGDDVAVAHEAVIRAWETLRGWIAEDREALMVRQELGRAAAPWALGGRLADDLWSGGRLKRAAELRDAGKLRLFGEEAAFLDAAEAAQRARVEAVEAAQRAELARERAARRRGRVVAIVALAGALVMAGLGGWARNEQGKAAVAEREARSSAAQEKTQKELARQSSLLAGARELLAQRQPAWAKGLLLEVQGAGDRSDWIDVALDALDERAPLLTYAGHASGVNLAAWSPDGRRVLTASEDRTAWVWNADGKGPRVRLAGHRGALYHAAWSPDGQRVATASEDRTARIWNADGTGAPLCLVAHEDAVTFLVWSPDGTRLATTSADGTARIWRADGAGRSLLLGGHGARDGHAGPVRAAAWSPDGALLVTASADRTARVWKTDGSGDSLVLRGHEGGLLDVSVDRPGRRVLTSAEDGTARVWSIDGKGEPRVLRGHGGAIFTAAFEPRGDRIVTSSVDRTARVWSPDGTSVPLVGHGSYLRAAAWAPDGRRILTVAWDNTARVWNADGSGAPLVLLGHRGNLMSGAWSPDGHFVLTGSADGTAAAWDVAESERHYLAIGHPDEVWSAAWSPDGARIVTSVGDRTARVWSADGTGASVVLAPHDGFTHAAAFAPDGRHVVTACWDGLARVWSTDGARTGVVLRGDHVLNGAGYSPDGKRLAVASSDGLVRLWDADGVAAPRLLRGHEGRVLSVAWSPDGLRLVSTATDGTARVWRADGAGEAIVLRGHARAVTGAAWSPDGARVVTASEDGAVRVFRADGAGAPARVGQLDQVVTSVAWSPDGSLIASGSEDHTVRLWNPDRPDRSIIFHGHRGTVHTVAFAPDGGRLLSASEDRTARVWDLARARVIAARGVDVLRQELAARNADCLPAALRRKYLDETEAQATERYQACEAAHGRPLGPPAGGGGDPGGVCPRL